MMGFAFGLSLVVVAAIVAMKLVSKKRAAIKTPVVSKQKTGKELEGESLRDCEQAPPANVGKEIATIQLTNGVETTITDIGHKEIRHSDERICTPIQTILAKEYEHYKKYYCWYNCANVLHKINRQCFVLCDDGVWRLPERDFASFVIVKEDYFQ